MGVLVLSGDPEYLCGTGTTRSSLCVFRLGPLAGAEHSIDTGPRLRIVDDCGFVFGWMD